MSTNFNDSVPAAPANNTNVKWQTDGSGNDSAYVPTPFLVETDVLITSLIPGDILVWNGATWVNAFPVFPANTPAIGGQALTGYDDTTGLFTQGVAGGDFVKLDEVIVPSPQTTITFSSISGAYRNLKLVVTGRADDGNPDIYMQFNGDTGSNYQYALTFSGSSNGESAAFSVAHGGIGSVASSSAPANQAGVSEICIYDYARTVFYKSATGQSHRLDGVSTGYVLQYGMTWNSTAAINAILIGKIAGSGNFVTGTVATLYGES
jgi:hypothetical protein